MPIVTGMTTTGTAQTMTIGNGTAVHVAYLTLDGKGLHGSLCNPFASERSRVRMSDRPANCPRCDKAVHRAAQQARHH